jgi:hypothetical protein
MVINQPGGLIFSSERAEKGGFMCTRIAATLLVVSTGCTWSRHLQAVMG